MSTERYPVDQVIGIDDFKKSGWSEALEAIDHPTISSMWSALSTAANHKITEGDLNSGKVLWLLADACSMLLKPTKTSEPFQPMWVSGATRSTLPQDFSEDDLRFFEEILDSIDDVWIQARIADLLWLRKSPRDPQFAHIAIGAYAEIPLDTETWVRDGEECWKRAFVLARTLGKPASDKVDQMEAQVIGALLAGKQEDGLLSSWLAELLRGHGLAESHIVEIAEHLASLSVEFRGDPEGHRERAFLHESANWYRRSENDERVVELKIAVAGSWQREAESRTAGNDPSHLVAASFFENAIQEFRSIPRKHRVKHDIDERIADLVRQLNDAGKQASEEMVGISTEPFDISSSVEQSKDRVRGKSLLEAIRTLADIAVPPRYSKARQEAVDDVEKHPLTALLPVTMMSSDGRVMARRPSYSLNPGDQSENDSAIEFEMVRRFQLHVELSVQGQIVPALRVLLAEHRIRERDLIELAFKSPIVPTDRTGLFGKGLAAGFELDFSSAIHFLVPQIENMVRQNLKATGEKTTTLSPQGIETENGLSSLMDLPKTTEILGEDLAFEIDALLCDPYGANLRNEIAHGLMSESATNSASAVYTWWLALRLVITTWWNKNHRQEDQPQADEANQ